MSEVTKLGGRLELVEGRERETIVISTTTVGRVVDIQLLTVSLDTRRLLVVYLVKTVDGYLTEECANIYTLTLIF